ncbi:MAG: hypothetical protein ACT4NU_06910 [Chromatiales bacterium]
MPPCSAPWNTWARRHDDGARAVATVCRKPGQRQESSLEFLDQILTEQVINTEVSQLGEVKQYDYYMTLMKTLGRRVAELHRAFTRRTGDPAFDPEPVTPEDIRQWPQTAMDKAAQTVGTLSQRRQEFPEATALLIDKLFPGLTGSAVPLNPRPPATRRWLKRATTAIFTSDRR